MTDALCVGSNEDREWPSDITRMSASSGCLLLGTLLQSCAVPGIFLPLQLSEVLKLVQNLFVHSNLVEHAALWPQDASIVSMTSEEGQHVHVRLLPPLTRLLNGMIHDWPADCLVCCIKIPTTDMASKPDLGCKSFFGD